MDIKGKTLVAIGGAGFIGSHTVEQLLREDVAEIRIYDNFTRGKTGNLAAALRDPRVKIFEDGGELMHRDILRAALIGADGVFHFAAMWLLHCHEYPRAAFEVNIGGTFNVLEAMLECGVKRLVFSSSASVYGDAVVEPMTEEHPYNNKTFYGATKIAGEHMCRALYHRYLGTSKEFGYTGLRYMNVYGPRQDYLGAYVSVIMKMLDNIDASKPPVIYGDGSQAYDFVYVGDCARANVLAMQSDVSDEFFNVGTGIKTTIRELAEHIVRLKGFGGETRFEPGGLTFVKNRVGCPKKAAQLLGFTAATGLEDGLRGLLAWREEQKILDPRHG